MNKDEFSKIFANNLTQIINSKYKTHKEFAKKFNESPQNIYKWTKGITLPDIYKIHKICESLNISLNDLIGLKQYNSQNNSIDKEKLIEIMQFLDELTRVYKKSFNANQILAIYENVVNLQELNNNLSTRNILKSLHSTLKNM